MQFTVTEADNLEVICADAGLTDARLQRAVSAALGAAGLGKYPVAFSVQVEQSDAAVSIAVKRDAGDPYPVDVLTGGLMSAEQAKALGITAQDIIDGAVVFPPGGFIDNRPKQVVEPAAASPDPAVVAAQPEVAP